MDLIGGIHDSLSTRVLIPFSRLHRSSRASTRPTQQAFDEGIRLRREAATWDDERKNSWILDRLRLIVRRAYEETVFYRERFDQHEFNPYADFDFHDFSRLPILTREDVHEAGNKLVASSVAADQLRKDMTGGSTGVPTEIWLGPNERGWRDSGMEYFFETLGVPEGSRSAYLWGHHLDPQASDSFRDRYQAFVSNIRWFDSLRLSADTLEQYHQELQHFRPACIIAYASALGHLAEHILSRNHKPDYPTVCLITGGEKLWDRHRSLIERAFGRVVHERYGGRDVGCLGVQLEPANTLAYTIDWANTLVEPETAEATSSILVTKIHGDGMPMLRYQVGDVGRFSPEDKPGHPTFVLPEVMGRVVDRISLPNGSWVTGLEVPHLLKDYPVREFLFLQRKDHSVELQIVPQKGFGEDNLNDIKRLLTANLPGLPIKIQLKESVRRTKSNKWRPVISESHRTRMNSDLSNNFEASVALAEVATDAYQEDSQAASAAIERLAKHLGWADNINGPLGALINPGARVLIKPNFVLDHNQGSGGMDPMVTHQSVVKAVVNAALRAQSAEVLVGDAPIQTCSFPALLRQTALDSWADKLKRVDSRFKGVKDFRRTTASYVNGVRMAEENILPEEEFVLFDLGTDSLLEPITNDQDDFRVTCYDPRLMAKTHGKGRHRYLVAKDVIEADVVINLPKLKTHKKAGITCALKNLVGINGNKEYLPHHRIGGANLGGDCYPGDSRVKRMLEYAADRQNLSHSATAGRVWSGVTTQLNRVLHLMGDNLGIEGSWSGNDTIWRTALDLNRIILYGKPDGTMAELPRRRVVHIVDAIIAGQGDGPLSPEPLNLGLMFAGNNAASVDRFGARLLGYVPQLIPIVRAASETFRWPISDCRSQEAMLYGDWGVGKIDDVELRRQLRVLHPLGWRDAAAMDAGANSA